MSFLTPSRARMKRDPDMYTLEDVLRRHGFHHVAGADEAGRGACAGPLVIAAAILPPGKRGRVPGLADSKLLTEKARDEVYDEVVDRALAYSIIVVPPAEVDAKGLTVCNLGGMRRALEQLRPAAQYMLTDGFPVPGTSAPNLGVWKGDRVAACVSAAGVLAKVTRDRIMIDLHRDHGQYGFDEHKGYSTEAHQAALEAHGPSAVHRRSYANVAAVSGVARAAQTV